MGKYHVHTHSSAWAVEADGYHIGAGGWINFYRIADTGTEIVLRRAWSWRWPFRVTLKEQREVITKQWIEAVPLSSVVRLVFPNPTTGAPA